MSKVKPTKNKGGAPTKYDEKYNEQARKLCLLGYTDVQLSDFFDITEKTLNNWKKAHEEFFQSLKAGKDMADADVVLSLYQKALGWSCKDTKFATHEGKITDSEEYTKNYPPCPISIKYWLNNRQSKTWRERVEIDNKNPQHFYIMPMPTADSVEEWEKVAQAQQEKSLSNV